MEQQEMVDPWRQPFPQIKPFRNGMAATSSFFAKQALTLGGNSHANPIRLLSHTLFDSVSVISG